MGEDGRAAAPCADRDWARHPNVGATLLDRRQRPARHAIADEIRRTGKPVEALILDECDHDAITLTERGLRHGGALTLDVSRQRRARIGLSELFLAIECGRSDPSSGLVSNPLVGCIVGSDRGGRRARGLRRDHRVARCRASARRAGGIAARRARDRGGGGTPRTAAVAAGIDLLGNNPGPDQRRRRPVDDRGEIARRDRQGRTLADTRRDRYRRSPRVARACTSWMRPAYAPESVSGIVAGRRAARAVHDGRRQQLCLGPRADDQAFGNPVAAKRLSEQLDFDASAVFERRETIDAAGERLTRLVLEVASGTRPWAKSWTRVKKS